MDSVEVIETLKAGDYYLKQLRSLDEEIKNALSQITNTSQETENSILKQFSSLENKINTLIMKKKTELLNNVSRIRDKAFAPLSDCQSLIKSKISETEELIDLGKNIQNKSQFQHKLEEFELKSSKLGNLPEVPDLKEVPCISFDYDITLEDEIMEIISRNGKVMRIAPVQICQMVEKPGSILVQWHIVELEDKSIDIQDFCLQRANGDYLVEKLVFETCYEGPDTQFLVKDLKVNDIYSFRVSCKFEGTNNFSQWSIPQKFYTKLKPFCWKENSDYSMNNENRIANPIVNSPSILISNGPQFLIGHTIEFKLLEIDPKTVAYLGIISDEKTDKLSSMDSSEGNFILNSKGEITVDGSKKSTHLPHFQKGSQVTFNCEIALNDKIVIHIDLNDKRVTYEWFIDKEQNFYFVAELPTTKWKIMVE